MQDTNYQGQNTGGTALEFEDTSTQQFLQGAADATPGGDAGDDADTDDLMHNFIVDPASKQAKAPPAPPSGEDGGDAPPPPAPPAPPADEVDYRSTYASWAQGKGLAVDASTLPEDFGKEQMEREVALYYTGQVVKDPLVMELARTGMTLEQYQQTVAPMRQLAALPPKDLFAHTEAEGLLAKEVSLGNIKTDDEEAKNAFYLAARAEAMKKVENHNDEAVEGVVSNLRQQLADQANELPNRVRSQQEQQANAERERLRSEYQASQKSMFERTKAAVMSGNSFGIPFTSQAEKTEFLDFYDKQTSFGPIAIKGKDGKEETVQDIPFFRELDDEQTMAKVVRILYSLKKGTFTDLKNGIRKEVVDHLGIEPVPTPSKSVDQGTDSRWAPTHEPSFLRGGG